MVFIVLCRRGVVRLTSFVLCFGVGLGLGGCVGDRLCVEGGCVWCVHGEVCGVYVVCCLCECCLSA